MTFKEFCSYSQSSFGAQHNIAAEWNPRYASYVDRMASFCGPFRVVRYLGIG